MGNWNPVNRRFVLGGGILGAEDMIELRATGVNHVISAAIELDDTELCIPGEVDFHHIMWQDDGQIKALTDFVNALDFVVYHDEAALAHDIVLPRYYIHCAAGVNRGPVLCTFLMAAVSGTDADTIWATITAARPQAQGFTVPNYRNSVLAALSAVWR